jgi:hypothetical protein
LIKRRVRRDIQKVGMSYKSHVFLLPMAGSTLPVIHVETRQIWLYFEDVFLARALSGCDFRARRPRVYTNSKVTATPSVAILGK